MLALQRRSFLAMSSPPSLVDAGDFPTLSRSGPSQRTLKRLRSKTNVQDEERQGPAELTPYFEAQRELMCGVHALNHAVGIPHFCSQDLDEAVDVVVAEAHACAAEVGEQGEEAICMHMGKEGITLSKPWQVLSTSTEFGSLARRL